MEKPYHTSPSHKDTSQTIKMPPVGETPPWRKDGHIQESITSVQQHRSKGGRDVTLNSDPKTHLKAAVQCVSGGISAGVVMLLIFPLDTAKTKLQTFGHLYKGGIHSLLVEWRAGGPRGVYRGLTPATLGAAGESCSYFLWHGVWQDVVRGLTGVSRTEQMTPLHNMAAGQLTGTTISLLMTPVELVKCRLQALREVAALNGNRPHSSFPSSFSFALRIYRQDGIRGLYTGFVGVFTKMVLGFGAMFGTYDLFRTYFVKEGQTKDQIGDLRHMVSGAAAGVAYWGVAYPLDLVKVRMQVNGQTTGRGTFFRLVLQALRTEGVRAMYRGFSLTALRAVIAFSITFTLYERIRAELLRLALAE